MKHFRFLLLCFLVVFNACTTLDHVQKKDPDSGWSSSDPLTIPYDIRLNQFEKGNLVFNPSFEVGTAPEDASEKSDRIKGWQSVGLNVSWVDSQAEEHSQTEVNTGRHSVKILRKTANELDEAEGVVSDFIEVIPGNYYFSYRVRLKNITSNKYRLGVQLYDAVVIKALYFDKDKTPLEPQILNPVSKSLVDNSDKGFSFSNYWTIDEFPWAEVRGRTYNYPFSEGDIPDGTRYVRLFLGLKGTGAMWVDDVVFRYSKWNFTALERFKPYFSRSLAPEQRIIPTPKRFDKIGEVHFYDATMPDSHLPVIVLPDNPGPADSAAARLMQEKIESALDRVMPAGDKTRRRVRIVEENHNLEQLINARLVFSIGVNQLFKKMKPHLPIEDLKGKPQGYILTSAQLGGTDVVFLYGDTALARYYAAATAIQLIDEDRAVYHHATVFDYPDFLGRSYVFNSWKNSSELQNDLETLSRLSLYKLNKVYLGYNRPRNEWHQADVLYRRGIREAGRWCRDSGTMKLGMMVNPYSHLGFETSAAKFNDQLRYRWIHGNPESIELLKGLYRLALDAGAETIMLLADDSVPHTGKSRQNYSLFADEDIKRFVSLQNAQAHVINQLKQWIDREYPGTRLEFCPPWYSNEHIDRSQGKAEIYFQELAYQIPQDVAIIWTGPTIRSLSVDMADLYRYKSLIGRWPMFWDNTLYARNLPSPNYGGYPGHYPGKVRMCNLFEPYDNYRPRGFHNYNDGRHMYTNGAADSEVYRIKYATVADYEWNTSDYNPELALWKVLVNSYGRRPAELLLRFNDAYYGVYQINLRLKSADIDPAGSTENAAQFLEAMREYIKALSAEITDQTGLLAELNHYLEQQEKLLTETMALYDDPAAN